MWGAGVAAGADQDGHDTSLLHASDNACGAVHGPHSALWQHSVSLSDGFFHPDAEGEHSAFTLTLNPYPALLSRLS